MLFARDLEQIEERGGGEQTVLLNAPKRSLRGRAEDGDGRALRESSCRAHSSVSLQPGNMSANYAAPSWPRVSGKLIANIAPNGGLGLAVIIPWWEAMTRRQIDSPSPIPSFFVV
jgi:hypothetical protein